MSAARDLAPAAEQDGLGGFLAALGDMPVARDPATLKRKSRDFYWYSPVLKPLLDGKVAEAVVTPRGRDDLLRLAAAAHRHRVPLTARGGGTGNYGQAVPMDGGVVVDMTALDRLLWVRDGVARVQAGTKMGELDAALRQQGWELRIYPSTKRTATIGGYVCGGFAGVGSISWGSLKEPGNLLALSIVTAEAAPRVLELRGADCNLVNHTYGTTGLVDEVEIPVQPAVRWRGLAVAFADVLDAARFAHALAKLPAIEKKLCSVVEGGLTPFFKPLREAIPDGHAAALLMIAPAGLEATAALAAEHGGRIVHEEDTAEAEADPARTPIYEFTWNHTTLQVLKQDRSVTYIQSLFPADGTIDKLAEMRALFGDEVLLHVEFVRVEGRVTCSALQVIRYTTEARLNEIMALHEAHGVMISNPHAYTLEDGTRYKRLPGDQAGFKRQVDPRGLLNPGKMRSFTVEDAA
ncbi:FAD-binding oxidoreductase [Roseomonas sp. BN140053]|uniref:FAD-binding oxidoreductase n=1 Tax=Roseomonas sp. BN140053 TaxID=3391898 RepID=UPI0039E886CB